MYLREEKTEEEGNDMNELNTDTDSNIAKQPVSR